MYLNSSAVTVNGRFCSVATQLGYELRSADPIPFDLEYTRDLGFGAVKFLAGDEATKYGAVISFVDGQMKPLSFESMLNPKTQRVRHGDFSETSEPERFKYRHKRDAGDTK